VDASQSFVRYVNKVLGAQNIKAKLKHGAFYDVGAFSTIMDIVIFEASFHHTDDPVRLMETLYSITSKDAKIYLLNEVISENFDRPWGVVNYEGEALFQIRTRGWLELGFRPDFLYEMAKRTGFMISNVYTQCGSNNLYELIKVGID
jgi:hypothetical protein